MAVGNSKPTREKVQELLDGYMVRAQCLGDELRVSVDAVDDMIERGWLDVAPEPVAEPDESPLYKIDDADGNTWEPTEIRGRWLLICGGTVRPWADIPQPVSLYRKVEDKPAPKYTAERKPNGDIWIDGNLFSYDSRSGEKFAEKVERIYHYHADRAAKYRAITDLLDREASGVGDK